MGSRLQAVIEGGGAWCLISQIKDKVCSSVTYWWLMVTYWFQQMASHHLYWLRFAHLLEFILRSSYDWFVWFHYTCSYETALCCIIRNADSHMSLQSLRFSAGALLGFQRMRLKFKDVCGFAIRVPWFRNNLYEWNMQPKTRCSRPARCSAFLQTPLCILLLSFPCVL